MSPSDALFNPTQGSILHSQHPDALLPTSQEDTLHSPGSSVVPDSKSNGLPSRIPHLNSIPICMPSVQMSSAPVHELPSWTHLPASGSSSDEEADEGADIFTHRLSSRPTRKNTNENSGSPPPLPAPERVLPESSSSSNKIGSSASSNTIVGEEHGSKLSPTPSLHPRTLAEKDIQSILDIGIVRSEPQGRTNLLEQSPSPVPESTGFPTPRFIIPLPKKLVSSSFDGVVVPPRIKTLSQSRIPDPVATPSSHAGRTVAVRKPLAFDGVVIPKRLSRVAKFSVKLPEQSLSHTTANAQLHSFTTPLQKKATRLFLDCVFITKPPPNKRQGQHGKGNTIAGALSYAFSQNKPADGPPSPTPTSTSASRSLTPRVFQRSARPKFSRSGRLLTKFQPGSKPLPDPVLSQAEIDAYLETHVAPIALLPPRSGREQVWREWLVGESATGRVRKNARFLMGYHVVLKDTEINKVALSESYQAHPYGTREKGRMEGFLDRLEDAFGPGSIFRGSGQKPRRGLQLPKNRITDSSRSDTGHSRSSPSSQVAEGEDRVGQSSISEAHIILGKRRRGDAGEREAKRAKIRISEDTAIEWVGTLQKLIKGKTRMDREELRKLSNVLEEIDERKDDIEVNVLDETRLRESITQLSQLREIPFGDEHRLRRRAGRIAVSWAH